eukprot:gb/GECH01010208.1/.p1 GENE.gb/GECH01010208.1/~~gb/GECH01010208.1/.p1  ORF type:complete len:224 (+),score=50.21 gb/GECH01010208.1/:1-672(+)
MKDNLDTTRRRTRYAGKPGSTDVVNFRLSDQAFGKEDTPKKAKEAKKYTKRITSPFKLGKKQQWNSSTYVDKDYTHVRRRISEHQSIQLPYNFRSEKLPETYKKNFFTSSASKFDFDQSLFLNPKDRENSLKGKNVKVNTNVSKDTLGDYSGWNNSTALTKKELEEIEDQRLEKSKKHSKKVSQRYLSNYVSPIKRQSQISQKSQKSNQSRSSNLEKDHSMYN